MRLFSNAFEQLCHKCVHIASCATIQFLDRLHWNSGILAFPRSNKASSLANVPPPPKCSQPVIASRRDPEDDRGSPLVKKPDSRWDRPPVAKPPTLRVTSRAYRKLSPRVMNAVPVLVETGFCRRLGTRKVRCALVRRPFWSPLRDNADGKTPSAQTHSKDKSHKETPPTGEEVKTRHLHTAEATTQSSFIAQTPLRNPQAPQRLHAFQLVTFAIKCHRPHMAQPFQRHLLPGNLLKRRSTHRKPRI